MNIIARIEEVRSRCRAEGLPSPDGLVLGEAEGYEVQSLVSRYKLRTAKAAPGDGVHILGFKIHFCNEPSACIPVWSKLAYEI